MYVYMLLTEANVMSTSKSASLCMLVISREQGDEVKLQHCKGVHALGEAAWPAKACENHDTDVGVCCVHATAH